MNMRERIGAGTVPAKAEGTVGGPRIYNLFPLLVGPVSAWRAELPRIAAMGFDWVYLNPFHETGGSRSLYAVKDPTRLDARFRDESAGDDDEQQPTSGQGPVHVCTAAHAASLRGHAWARQASHDLVMRL